MSLRGVNQIETRPPVAWRSSIESVLAGRPFRPHRLFPNGHAQTLVAHAWPRRVSLVNFGRREERFFEVEPDVKVLAHCHWQENAGSRPTAILVHGLEGSSSSVYMVSTARLFFDAGFNVLRYNMRNCGGTDHLTTTLYHSGMSSDLQAVVRELINQDHLEKIFLMGFSMGGNVSLKLAGEYSGDAPKQLRGVCAISPALDLSACADAINRRSNWIYQRSFLKGLRRRVRDKERLYPEIYSIDGFRSVRSIRDFDEVYTARHAGFASADDYYERSSAVKVLDQIRTPTLIIHAQDDPFIPYESFRDLSSLGNDFLVLLTPAKGGHVGFVADDPAERFWAEGRALDFCRLLSEHQAGGKDALICASELPELTS